MDQYFEEIIDTPPEVPEWVAVIALILIILGLSL